MEIPLRKIANNVGAVSAIVLGLGCQLLPEVDFINVGDKFIKPDFNNGALGYNLNINRGVPYRGFQSLSLFLGVVNAGLLLLPVIEQTIKEEQEKSQPKDLLPDFPISPEPEPIEDPTIAPKALKLTSLSERLQATDKDLLEWLETPHQSVAGNSGTGKTTIMQYVISLWLAENPTGSLTLLDSNIGKPDSQGKPNNWAGLAKNYGVSALPDIIQAMDGLYDELQRRLTVCRDAVKNDIDYLSFDPYLIVIDEFNSLQEDLMTIHKYNIVTKLQLLLQQGRALNMKVLVGLQSYDKETSGLPMASNAMTSKLWLGYKNIPTDLQFRYLSIDKNDSARQDFTQLIKDKKRAGLIQINGVNRAISMPDLSTAITIKVDDAEVWWQEWKDSNAQILDRAISEGLSPTEVADMVTPKVRRGTPKFRKIQKYLTEK